LLAAEERAALEDDDFEDEEINPFVITDTEQPRGGVTP
jgi:hypothetical protein